MIESFLAFILAMSPLDLGMTQQDKKKTGVYKLSDKEKDALQEWVDANYSKKDLAAAPSTQPKKPSVSEVLNNGNYIKLTDGSLWNIRPGDTPISQSWITEVEIIITSSGDPKYPSKLTNSLTKSSVYARRVNALPSAAPTAPTPPPKAETPASG